MKKHIFGKKLKRDVNQRQALFKSLMSELVMHGRIKTTEQKAKAIRSSAEKLIKKAQKETLLARKLLSSDLIPQAIEKAISDIGPKFVGRNGGYTRIVKLGRRFNDDASLVLLEWVENVGIQSTEKRKPKSEKQGVTKKKSAKVDIVEGEIISEKAGVQTKKGTTAKKTNNKKKSK